MLRFPATALARVVPDRSNRSLLWLTAGIGYPFIIVGPVAASFIYQTIYGIAFWSAFGHLILVNVVSLTLALIIGALYLRSVAVPLDGRRALIFAIAVGAGGALLRFAGIRIAYAIGLTPFPDVGTSFFLIQLALGMLFIVTITVALLYAVSRERALDEAFLELSRAQVSLAQEEEQVRAEVFDQLHGSLQAQFVAMRQKLVDLASENKDPTVVREVLQIEQDLERAYRDGVQPLTRTLVPAGLEAGLGIALAELDTRLAGAMDIEVRMDPIIETMDNPMTGGIHRDARMAAYRIIEEAASNAMEHSHARLVVVMLSSHLADGSARLDLEVAHEIPAPVTVMEGSGLARMRARARALGGQVAYTSEPGRFVVRASLPLALPDGGRWAGP